MATGLKPERFVASLILTGKTLQPDEITSLLGITPTRVRKNPKSRQKLPHASGAWELESSLPNDMPLENHLNWLLEQLDGKEDEIRKCKKLGYEIMFYCGCFLTRRDGVYALSTGTIKRIAAFDVQLFTHVVYYGEPPEAD